MSIRKKRNYKKWLGIIGILAMVGVIGGLALGRVVAIEGEEEESYPTFTVVSVSQYDEPIEPVWDEYLFDSDKWEFGNYYYPVANNSDKVRVGVRVEGLKEGKTYELRSYSWTVDDSVVVTSEDNGEIVYKDVEPYVNMVDSVACTYENEIENCGYNHDANEYTAVVYLKEADNWRTYNYTNVILRPAVVGSSDIEILSVKQNGTDIYLDTVGRRVKDINVLQTINEYQIMDYTSPVTVEYRLKNLHEGWSYNTYIGNGSNYSFVADATEKTITQTINLGTRDRRSSVQISMHGWKSSGASGISHESYTRMFFKIINEDYVPLGRFIINGISQGGEAVEARNGENNHEFYFDVNDVQDLEVNLSVTTASDDLVYYLSYWLSGNSSSASGNEWLEVSGLELKNGVTLTVPARYGESERSPFQLYLELKSSLNNDSYDTVYYYYLGQGDHPYGYDNVKFQFYEDESIPRINVDYTYAVYQGDEELTANNEGVYVISDYTKPISLKAVFGESTTNYELRGEYVSYGDDGNEIDNTTHRYGSYYRGAGGSYLQIYLDINAKITRANISVYDLVDNQYGSFTWNRKLDEFSLDFAYADYDGSSIPSLELTEIRQGGIVVEPANESPDSVSFAVNPYEDYEYDAVGYNLLAGEVFTVYSYNERMVLGKSELESGVTVYMPAGMSGSIIGNSNYYPVFGSNNRMTYHGKIVNNIYTDYSLGNDVPVYDVCMMFRNSERCLSGAYPSFDVMEYNYTNVPTSEIENYDAVNNPVVIRIKGEKYDNATRYGVNIKVKYLDSLLVDDSFEALGSELMNGIDKEYIDELRYVTLNQFFDGTFEEGGYEVMVTIGNTTRRMGFMFNGGGNTPRVILSKDGLTFDSYYMPEGGGMGFAGGNVFVGHYEMSVPEVVFGDHAYLYIGALETDADEANYHVYRYPTEGGESDLSSAELLHEGVISSTEEVGFLRLDKGDYDTDVYYAMVIERNGRILFAEHYLIEFVDSEAGVGLAVGLKSDEDGALVVSGYYGSSYQMTKDVPVDVYLYGGRLDEGATYEAEITVRANNNQVTFSDSKRVGTSELTGETSVFTIPFANLFSGANMNSNVIINLKDGERNSLITKSAYLSRSENYAVNGIDGGTLYAGVRAIEEAGEEPEEPEEPEGPEVDIMTPEDVNVSVEEGSLMMVASKPSLVIGLKDGVYTLAEAGNVMTVGGLRAGSYDVSEFDEVKVVLKGDGTMDGVVSSADLNKITRSLVGSSLPAHKNLTELEQIILDVTGDNRVTSADTNRITRSLIGTTLPAYKALEW